MWHASHQPQVLLGNLFVAGIRCHVICDVIFCSGQYIKFEVQAAEADVVIFVWLFNWGQPPKFWSAMQNVFGGFRFCSLLPNGASKGSVITGVMLVLVVVTGKLSTRESCVSGDSFLLLLANWVRGFH